MMDGTGGNPYADDPFDATNDYGDLDDIASTASTDSETLTAKMSTSISDESESTLPYIYRRDPGKGGRNQVRFILRDHVQALEDEFINLLVDRIGETES
jgi:hypothetical protein